MIRSCDFVEKHYKIWIREVLVKDVLPTVLSGKGPIFRPIRSEKTVRLIGRQLGPIPENLIFQSEFHRLPDRIQLKTKVLNKVKPEDKEQGRARKYQI